MSVDDPPPKSPAPTKDVKPHPKAQPRSWFDVPPPLKRIFDKFPLVTYDENALPLRAVGKRRKGDEHALYVFATEEDARRRRPSFNPACLRWQTYLKLSGISYKTIASNNHASPSGALPFLLPAAKDETMGLPVTSNRLKRWVLAQQKDAKRRPVKETEDVRLDAYQSLLEGAVRIAWLYQLYLNPANAQLLHRLYIAPCSSNPFVQMTIGHQLRQAAETEIVKSTGSDKIVEADLMRAAEDALTALSTLLGQEQWFFGQARPGLFDASVFAYAHLSLDEDMEWRENRLGEVMITHENLVKHRQRVGKMCY